MSQAFTSKLPTSKLSTGKTFFNQTLVSYLCASILLCSFITVKASAITLTVTDNLIIRDVDDKPVEHGFLSKKQQLELTQGQHSLVIKYKDVFEDLDFAEDRLVTSDYFVVTFTVENQQKLLLTTSKINDLATAERFVRAPELSLLDENKQGVVLDLATLADYELAKQVTKVVTTLSTATVIAQANDIKVNSKVTNNNANHSITSEQAFNAKVINKVDTVPMLKYWWRQASHDEKNKFIDFINKNKELK